MIDRPDARELIEIAHEVFTAEMLPAVPDALRYKALMIANAMAIAQRELAAGNAPLRDEYRRLSRLLSETTAELSGEALRAAVETYNRRLANEIRGGAYDEDERAAMLEHLRRTTEGKLAVSNPKALTQPGGVDPERTVAKPR